MKRIQNIFILFTLLVVMIPCVSLAQFSLTKANKYYKEMAYSRAIPLYEKTLAKDPLNDEAMIKLADCYRLTNNPAKAEEWYARVVSLDACRPIYKFYYAQALMENGKYDEANRWMK
ncbi:MAG: tetratricopeptide repeat protein, partial [Bacteroidia bacterium]|nr:tetratricopeptide repeat protein [Bacteroidia bacterium]